MKRLENNLMGGSGSGSQVVVITIEILEDDGLYIVTSPQFPEINVAHPRLDAIFDDLPQIIKAVCKDRYGEDMLVVPARSTEERSIKHPWVAIPAHIAAAATAG